MGKKQTFEGQTGRGDTLNFLPEALKVVTDPKHPLYDPRVERPPSERLILSIMRRGVLVPLLIYRDGDDVYVEDGRQRRAAAIEANKRLKKAGGEPVVLPCVWKRGDEATLYEISITTNELRDGDSPLERARKMQHLLDLRGGDVDGVAVTFGVTPATVKNHLALLECAPAVQRAIEGGKVAASIASKLAKMPRTEQVKTLDKMIASGATKGAAAQHAVRTKGDAATPLRKALTASERKRIVDVLRTKSMQGHTSKLNSDLAEAMAAAIDFVGGDPKALDSYPAIESWLTEDDAGDVDESANGSAEAQA